MSFNHERYSQKDSDAKFELDKAQKLMNWHDAQSRAERTFIRTLNQLCEIAGTPITTQEEIEGKMVSTVTPVFTSPNALGGNPMKEPYRIEQKSDLISNNNKRRIDVKSTEPIDTPDDSIED